MNFLIYCLLYYDRIIVTFVLSIIFLLLLRYLILHKKKLIIFISILLYSVIILSYLFPIETELYVKRAQGSFFYVAKQYHKSLDIYESIRYADGIDDCIVDIYHKGSKYYYDTKQYKNCIDLVDRIYNLYSYDYDNSKRLWGSFEEDYKLFSYISLYNDIKQSNNKDKLIEITDKIHRIYDDEYLNEHNIIIDSGITNYEMFEYLKDDINRTASFGKLGSLGSEQQNNETNVYWNYLYREDNHLFLICSSAISRRYMHHTPISELEYYKSDMYHYLNDYLYNAMFTDEEKKAIVDIDDNEKVSLLSEKIINKICNSDNPKYLNDLFMKKHNSLPEQYWLKSNIVDGGADCFYLSEDGIIHKDFSIAYNAIINVVPVICVNVDEINKLAHEDKIRTAEKHKKEQLEKIIAKKQFNDELHNKINSMKKVSDYPDGSTIEDFDTIHFGHRETIETSFNIPWILLDKKDGKALLLSKYCLYDIDYCGLIDSGLQSFLFRYPNYYNYKDFVETKKRDFKYFLDNSFDETEIEHILDTDIIISDNNMYKTYNDFGTLNVKQFLLSINDINKYFLDKNNKVDTNKLITYKIDDYNGIVTSYWLRDIGELFWTASYVDIHGNLNYRGSAFSNKIGYRPAIWISY